MKTFLILLISANTSLYAMEIDCRGKYITGEDVYFASHPIAPYDRSTLQKPNCVNYELPTPDYVFVWSVDFKKRRIGGCEHFGEIFDLYAVSNSELGDEIEIRLSWNKNGRAFRALRMNKATGAGTYFNILENGKIVPVTGYLKCKF